MKAEKTRLNHRWTQMHTDKTVAAFESVFIRTTIRKSFVFLSKLFTTENAKIAKIKSYISLRSLRSLRLHIWLRRQPRQVHPWLKLSDSLFALRKTVYNTN